MKSAWTVLTTSVALLSLLTAVFFFFQFQQAQTELQRLKKGQPTANAPSEVKQIIDRVGKLMDLPPDENPTLATVTNRETLQSQAFFANAANGDKVLVYQGAKKAILYRPSTNRIINVAPITLSEPTPLPPETTATAKPIKSPMPIPSELP
jgi:hypothetical protein